MKKIFVLLSAAVCVISFFSCHKDTKVIPTDFYFKASKFDADWAAQGSSYHIPGDSLRLAAFKPAGEEHINFNIKFNGVGEYPLTGNQAEYYTTVGLDVVTSHYNLDTARNNSITISTYNQATHIISGKFQIRLLNNTFGQADHSQLIFSNGLFRVKLPD